MFLNVIELKTIVSHLCYSRQVLTDGNFVFVREICIITFSSFRLVNLSYLYITGAWLLESYRQFNSFYTESDPYREHRSQHNKCDRVI